jgi:hypothetical protein
MSESQNFILHEAYRQSVLLSFKLGEQVAEELKQRPDMEFPIDMPFPPCYMIRHDIGGEVAYQLSYDGMLPLYFEKHPEMSVQMNLNFESTVH